VPRALTAGERRLLKTALLPFVQTEYLDLSSLATQGWPGRLEASVRGPASTSATGLCTARQRITHSSGKYLVEMSVRFGPNGPEPWDSTGCPIP